MPKMAREMSAVEVRRLATPGFHAVGGVPGLLLQVTDSGSKSWVLRTMVGNRRRGFGLGGFPEVSLSVARDKARELREKVRQGIDPIAEKQAARAALIAAQSKAKTFEEIAADVIAKKQRESRNLKHAQQWANTLERYAFPTLGELPVSEIQMGHVVETLKPIWESKTETATRVRQRIEAVMSLAIARGYRTDANPATWSLLKNELPAAAKIKKTKHYPALPWRQVSAFIAALRKQEGTAAHALEFLILTASRSGEVRNAAWDEIDFDGRLWVIPGHKMKGGREHRVPLCPRALEVLRSVQGIDRDLVFPGSRGGPMSDGTIKAVVKRMHEKRIKAHQPGWVDPQYDRVATPHGFRSSFKDWAREMTGYADEVSELALAHVNTDATRAAYARGELLDKRRRLMKEWEAFCSSPTQESGDNVVPIREVRA
ncbi:MULTISPECIES: site-specific integrase [unclassified Guyparkeria]|uniref:tyrosine-type recombinase/integrase n=1 Tax=unclassified Guyparkeria TaxID=2626246 RepID=UPI000733931D|nr:MULTISPECIES: site-specific integrase [unclassified Guyparkeria]KTG15989.1 integrase [Guyparkeria sp. XI15]OAE84744.1 integrase [Guyparkeria sp. WRN-7]